MVGMEEPAVVVASSEGSLQIPLTFEEFFEAQRGRLFRALLLVTHDAAQAEDLMQESFVRVWERWDRLGRPSEDPVGYLFRTAMNVHRSARRRAVVAARNVVRPTPRPDPFDDVVARDEVTRSLARLAPRQRAAVVVMDLLGYTSQEASEILGIRAGTVRTLTSQARATLLAGREPTDD